MTSQDTRLTDDHIVVTGGARGIGRGIAVRCARAGADVSIFDTRPETAAETVQSVEEHDSDAQVLEVDVSDAADVRDAVESARDGLGPIDGLVNNAGIQDSVPILETDLDQWESHFAVNARGTFLCSKHVATAMIDDDVAGSIVNVSSVAAERPFRGQGMYGATKGAIETFTRVLAKELSDHGITVNAIKPGTIETPMVERWLEENAEQSGKSKDELLAETIEAHLLDRIGRPEEIGHVAALLLSEEGEWITGESVAVDGGYLNA